MLEAIRKGTKTWLFKGFLSLLVLSFAVWGIGDIFRGSGTGAVAIVGDEEITPQQFDNAYRREYQRLADRLGGRLDAEQARDFGLVESTLNLLIGRVAIDGAMRAMGLTAAEDVVAQDIRSNPAFHNDKGAFDRAIFRRVLSSNGFSEEAYLASLRRDVARDQLLGAITSGAHPPQTLIERLYAFREEHRIAEFLVIPNESVGDVGSPDDPTLEVYHGENAAQFTAPEYRALTYVTLTADDLVAELRVSEEELAEEYDIRLDEFITPERRSVEQLLYDAEEVAREAYRQIEAGGDFHNVGAATNSLTAANPSLGEITRDSLPADIADQVFALAVETISKPLKGPFGWHLFRVTRIEPEITSSLDDVREELTRDIALARAGDALFEIANQIEDEFAAGANLAAAAGRLNLRLERIAAVDAEGNDPSGQSATLTDIDEFLEVAFTAGPGDEPVLNESADGGYFLVQVDRITASALRPFAGIREDVRAAWLAEKRGEAARTAAEALAAKLNNGGDFASLARAAGASLQTTNPLARADFAANRDIPPRLLFNLFKLKAGQASSAPRLDQSGQVVARVAEIRSARPATAGDETERLRDVLTAAIVSDLTTQYRTSLQIEAGVRINRQVIDSLF